MIVDRIRKRVARVGLSLILLASVGVGCAELAAMQLPMGFPAPLDESTVAAGLRQALEFGSQRASNALSRTGGFSSSVGRVFRLRCTLASRLARGEVSPMRSRSLKRSASPGRGSRRSKNICAAARPKPT